jgi:hypothetical protein
VTIVIKPPHAMVKLAGAKWKGSSLNADSCFICFIRFVCPLSVYRFSFRQTFAEMNAPTGEWKSVVSGVLLGLSITALFYIYLLKYG